ncbi:hypothetical protein ACFH04_06365 [Streptomyces noboritoensis]|uniref:Uncharacterized protein n=1 Tax=Streptomyces noboritoensis TaxID=67337 RepID=A0ABV6TC37_9ACTN
MSKASESRTCSCSCSSSRSPEPFANSLLRQVLLGAVCSLGSEAVSWFLLWWQHR